MEIYDNENLKRLMEECIKEVHENTCYIRFDTSKIKRIYASDTTGKVLGRCHRTKTANGWEFEIIIFNAFVQKMQFFSAFRGQSRNNGE